MDKKIAKNFFYSAAYRVLISVIPLITAPYVARVLKPEGNGIYGITSAWATVFSLFATLGFVSYGQREIAYKQEDKHCRSIIFYEICFLRFITTTISLIIFIIFCFAYKRYTVYLLPQTMLIISGVFDIAWFYQGIEDFRITVVRNTLVKIVSVCCIFLFVKTPDHLIIYIFILSGSTFVSNLLYFINISKHVEKIEYSELHPLRHFRGTIEFFIPLIAVEIYSHLDKIMLGSLITNTAESGYYEQARKITTIVVGFIISINSVMMSRISSLYAKKEKNMIIHFYKKSYKIMILFLLPICIGMIIISNNFVIWFFGEEYSNVSILLKLSSLLIVFMCIGNFIGVQYLSPTGQQNRMTIAYIIAAISNIILNAILIPRMASSGAMIASIIAELISCFIQLYFFMNSEYSFDMLNGIWKYITAVIGMAAVLVLINNFIKCSGVVQSVLDIGVGGIIYFLLLYVFKEENCIMVWNKILRRNNEKNNI